MEMDGNGQREGGMEMKERGYSPLAIIPAGAYNKKFNSPRNGSTVKKIDRERQYTTERTSKHYGLILVWGTAVAYWHKFCSTSK